MKTKINPVALELQRIADESDGVLVPEAVVEAARPEASPLHSRFTWDDSEAAHQYRIWQARQLIRVTVEIVHEGQKEPSRMWVSLKPDRNNDGGGYRSMISVMSDADMATQLLKDAHEEMESFEQKYSGLKELAEVIGAMRKARRRPLKKAA
jgi:hypothetical protein